MIPRYIRSCILCPRFRQNECVRASHMWGDTRRLGEIALEVGYRRNLVDLLARLGRDPSELEQGIHAHKLLEEKRGVLKDPRALIKSLMRGRPVPFTARFCSRYYGFRTQPDVVFFELKRGREDDRLTVVVVEDKRVPRKSYWTQVYTTALVLTDYGCLMMPAVPQDREDALFTNGEFMEGGTYLYDFLVERLGLKTRPRVEVYCTLNPYKDFRNPVDNPLPSMLFSRDHQVLLSMGGKQLHLMHWRKRIIDAVNRMKPSLLVEAKQTRFTTRRRRGMRIAAELDDKLSLYVPADNRI